MNPSLTFPSHNVSVQSSGPCVVCDGTLLHDQQADSSTVHPSCLSRITSLAFFSSSNEAGINQENMSSSCSSVSTSSSETNIPDGGSQLWLCRNCNQLQSPLNFPVTNDEYGGHSYTYSNQDQILCYDCSIDMLDFDFGSLAASDASGSTVYDYDAGRNSSTDSNMLPAFPQRTTEVWACTYCQGPKRLQEFSSFLGLDGSGVVNFADTAICDGCMVNVDFNNDDGAQQFPGWDAVAGYDLRSFLDSDYYGLPEVEVGSLSSNNTNNYIYNGVQPQAAPSNTRQSNPNTTASTSTTSSNTTRTKRKQTHRPKPSTKPATATASDTALSNSNNEPNTEPVIQWISRREPLPPNVCSRCRCRYVRPGKKQCQHCAYDYRGTRDHRASMGLCITCAEPLERDVEYAPVSDTTTTTTTTAAAAAASGNTLGGSESGTGTGTGGATKPRRSCKACREKNRLKKAAEKAARLRMMAAEGAGGSMGQRSDGMDYYETGFNGA